MTSHQIYSHVKGTPQETTHLLTHTIQDHPYTAPIITNNNPPPLSAHTIQRINQVKKPLLSTPTTKNPSIPTPIQSTPTKTATGASSTAAWGGGGLLSVISFGLLFFLIIYTGNLLWFSKTNTVYVIEPSQTGPSSTVSINLGNGNQISSSSSSGSLAHPISPSSSLPPSSSSSSRIPIIPARFNVTSLNMTLNKYYGIGGMSAGSSNLLFSYREPYFSEIIDYLFKPQFGASLQILKVEIGGDVFDTVLSEASHMHNANDLNCYRGFEWKLMVEAKKRNPNIKLYGLPWGFPSWVVFGGEALSINTVNYTLQWFICARDVYNLKIDYLGCWNERQCNVAGYFIPLKATLALNGFTPMFIGWDQPYSSCNQFMDTYDTTSIVDIIGNHYPRGQDLSLCYPPKKPVWASEAFWQPYQNGAFAGCESMYDFANYNISAYISWTLLGGFYAGVVGQDVGVGYMGVLSPWSNTYEVGPGIWYLAHTTQFTDTATTYIFETGFLTNGYGMYVIYTDFYVQQFTIVIINNCVHWNGIDPEHGQLDQQIVDGTNTGTYSFTYKLPSYLISTFTNTLHYFYTLEHSGEFFIYGGIYSMIDNNYYLTITVPANSIVTYSSLNGTKGAYPVTLADAPFTLPWQDNYQQYNDPKISYVDYLQITYGSFELYKNTSNVQVLRQTLRFQDRLNGGISQWVLGTIESTSTFGLLGHEYWTMIQISTSVLIESTLNTDSIYNPYASAFVCANANLQTFEDNTPAVAILFRISLDNTWALYNTYSYLGPADNTAYNRQGLPSILNGTIPFPIYNNTVYNITMVVLPLRIMGYVNRILVLDTLHMTSINNQFIGAVYSGNQIRPYQGFVGIGGSYDRMQFSSMSVSMPAVLIASWHASIGITYPTQWIDNTTGLLFTLAGNTGTIGNPIQSYNGLFTYTQLTNVKLYCTTMPTLYDITIVLVYQYVYYTRTQFVSTPIQLWGGELVMNIGNPYGYDTPYYFKLYGVKHTLTMDPRYLQHSWHVMILTFTSNGTCLITIDNTNVLTLSTLNLYLPFLSYNQLNGQGVYLFDQGDVVNIKQFDMYSYAMNPITVQQKSDQLLSLLNATATTVCSYLTTNLLLINVILSLQPDVYWIMNDTYGSNTIRDYSGNQFNGVYTNPTIMTYCDKTLTPRSNISSITFPATLINEIFFTDVQPTVSLNTPAGGYSAIPLTIIPGRPVSIGMFFRTTNRNYQVLFNYGIFNGNVDHTIYMNADGSIGVYIYDTTNEYSTSSLFYNDGASHFLMFTLSSTGLHLYIDGSTVVFNAAITHGRTYNYPFPYLWIAGDQYDYYSGSIGHFMYWSNLELTLSQVQLIYNNK